MKLPEEAPALSSNVAGRLTGKDCSSCRAVQVPAQLGAVGCLGTRLVPEEALLHATSASVDEDIRNIARR